LVKCELVISVSLSLYTLIHHPLSLPSLSPKFMRMLKHLFF
jgi:hypothetical protein